MNYDLALRLKKAWFPQYNSYTLELAEKNGGTNPDYLKTPTLEELIDACGESFISLSRYAHAGNKDGYRCEGRIDPKTTYACVTDSPTAAVANLYLALHPNNKV